MRLRIAIPARAVPPIIRYCFLLTAAVCLGLYGYAYVQRASYQAYESREFDRTAAREAAAFGAFNEKPSPMGHIARTSRKPATSPGPPSSSALIGRLSVPRLHLSAMVREGVDWNTLRLAIGHIPATALPGQVGNIGVAGHRDTFFRELKNVRAGDEIRFSTLSGDFKYEVESLVVVDPDNIAVLAASSGYVLTLVTCYPFSYLGSAPKRFVVRARQVSPQAEPLSIVE